MIHPLRCIDAEGKTQEYSVDLSLKGMHYTGCAQKVDNFLVPGREGNFANLLKHLGYHYTGEHTPENMRYSQIETQGDLLTFMVSWELPESKDPEDYEENREFFVLGKTATGWETYYQGNQEISEETCEKYVSVPGLMDFSLFNQCPRG